MADGPACAAGADGRRNPLTALERTNPITPAGMAALRARYDHLLGDERPKLVEVISWAAGNGDRSENGDYIYGRKKLREIDQVAYVRFASVYRQFRDVAEFMSELNAFVNKGGK